MRLAALLLTLLCAGAAAQTFPARPVRLVVPVPPDLVNVPAFVKAPPAPGPWLILASLWKSQVAPLSLAMAAPSLR